MSFSESDLAVLAATQEIEIETRAADGTVHRTIVWPVVRADEVYLRSFKGPAGRWYREALEDPAVALHVGGRRLAGQAIHAPDATSVDACSDALREKYTASYSLA
ncbi:MAG: DUF2255 family protein, partial [Candidatus Limnocylindrales bacterium]